MKSQGPLPSIADLGSSLAGICFKLTRLSDAEAEAFISSRLASKVYRISEHAGDLSLAVTRGFEVGRALDTDDGSCFHSSQ